MLGHISKLTCTYAVDCIHATLTQPCQQHTHLLHSRGQQHKHTTLDTNMKIDNNKAQATLLLVTVCVKSHEEPTLEYQIIILSEDDIPCKLICASICPPLVSRTLEN